MLYPFALAVCLLVIIALVLLLAVSYHERSKITFQVSEAMHMMRWLHMHCPVCKGGGTLAMPGATVSCTYCGASRRLLGWLLAMETHR